MIRFVDFTGEETEKEFLAKCVEQWDEAIENGGYPDDTLMFVSTIFREIKHRVEELD